MPTDMFCTPLQVNCVPFLIFKSCEMNLSFWTESTQWNRQRQGAEDWMFPGLASLLTHVTSTFQRDQNFHPPVVLLAQLEGPAWPFSYCPVGTPFDIGGNPRAECENRMRSWLQGLLDLWAGSQREQIPRRTDSLLLTKTSVPARLTAARCKTFLC